MSDRNTTSNQCAHPDSAVIWLADGFHGPIFWCRDCGAHTVSRGEGWTRPRVTVETSCVEKEKGGG